MHCSSLGEFEQGRPVIEAIREQYPELSILVSFFSPSGYEVRKNYQGADHVVYLPMDTEQNAFDFLNLVNPQLVIFVKYEYWFHYMKECNWRKIPLLMVSAIFREDQVFFKSYGSLFRKMLGFVDCFFVQDETSRYLLSEIDIDRVIISGDTRFDRVITIARSVEAKNDPSNHPNLLVAGSSWGKDEKLIRETLDDLEEKPILVIAPHEVSSSRIRELKSLFDDARLYSETGPSQIGVNGITIVDTMGHLSRLYSLASVAYIGGGFDSGIHNILEAAVYGKPVIFGPRYQKFREATDLVSLGGAFSVENAKEFKIILSELLKDHNKYSRASEVCRNYVKERKGATDKVLSYIQMNRLLTS